MPFFGGFICHCLTHPLFPAQLNQVTNQGLKEAVAQAQGAYPLLAELFASVVADGTSSSANAAALAGLGRLAAPQPPPQQPQNFAPQRESPDSALLRVLNDFARTGQLQRPMAPAPPPQVQQPLAPIRSFASPATNLAPAPPAPGGFRPAAPMTYSPSLNASSFADYPHLGKRLRPEDPRQCCNCGVGSTPFWRKDRQSGLPLCNACGLYAAKNDHPRPARLWREGQFADDWEGDGDGELQRGREILYGTMPSNQNNKFSGASGSGVRPPRPPGGAPGIVAWPPLRLPTTGHMHQGSQMESMNNMAEFSSCPPRIGELPANLVASLAPSASAAPPASTGAWRRPNLAAHSPYDLAHLVQQVQQAQHQASLQQNLSQEPPKRNEGALVGGGGGGDYQHQQGGMMGRPPPLSAAFVSAVAQAQSQQRQRLPSYGGGGRPAGINGANTAAAGGNAGGGGSSMDVSVNNPMLESSSVPMVDASVSEQQEQQQQQEEAAMALAGLHSPVVMTSKPADTSVEDQPGVHQSIEAQ